MNETSNVAYFDGCITIICYCPNHFHYKTQQFNKITIISMVKKLNPSASEIMRQSIRISQAHHSKNAVRTNYYVMAYIMGRPPRYITRQLSSSVGIQWQWQFWKYISKPMSTLRTSRTMQHQPWPLSFWTKNWHISHVCPAKHSCHFSFSASFSFL